VAVCNAKMAARHGPCSEAGQRECLDFRCRLVQCPDQRGDGEIRIEIRGILNYLVRHRQVPGWIELN
jgi:hypothetical protein